tara:strand:- start:482 stop:994 length:513 start_codon:yes stop_codon:yes gene_type:complete
LEAIQNTLEILGIKALKAELSEGSLEQSDVFGYWLASTILLQLTILPMSMQPTGWDYLFWALSFAVTVVLLRKCYIANGGESGVKFSDKLVSISWVMLIRGFLFVFLPLFVIGSMVATFVGIALGYSDGATANLVENCVLGEAFIFEIWVWLRIAAHIRDVRESRWVITS